MAKLYSALVSLALLLIGGDWARLVHSAKEASKVIQHVSQLLLPEQRLSYGSQCMACDGILQ